MTKQEFESFIDEQKKSGKSEDEIVTVFCLMFKDGELDRAQLEACLTALGYEMSEELKAKDDEELKKEIVTREKTEEPTKEDKVDPDGDVPPEAKKPEDKEPEEKEEIEEKEESVSEKESDDDGKEDDEEERKRAFKLFGLED